MRKFHGRWHIRPHPRDPEHASLSTLDQVGGWVVVWCVCGLRGLVLLYAVGQAVKVCWQAGGTSGARYLASFLPLPRSAGPCPRNLHAPAV